MKKEIKYRLAKANDYKAILALYNDSYQARRSVSDVQWLYDNNPMGKGTLFIATVDNQVIGMQGIVKYQSWKSQNVIDMYKSEDSLIHEDYRGKGVYKRLYQMVFDFIGKTPIWGLTDKKTILERTGLPSEKRFNVVASVRGFVTPSLFKNKAWAKTILYNSLNFTSLLSRNKKVDSGFYTTESITDFTDTEQFGKSLSQQYPDIQMPILSKDVIQWRLPNNPKVKDWNVFAMHNAENEIKALTLVTYNGKMCRWLSSYFHTDVSKKDRSHHIKEVQNLIFSEGRLVIEQWLFDTNQVSETNSQLMLDCGFRHVKKGLWIIKNQPKENATVHEILFSAQLGLD